MKRILILSYATLLFASVANAQEGTPAPPPVEPQVPAEHPGMSRSAPPSQAVVPVPVPMAPPKPNGPVQKSLVRITATAVDPDYKAPWNAGALERGVGAAFQCYSGDVAQGVDYMIPTPVMNRFLKAISNGQYDEYPDLAITYAKLQNPAQRKFLGLQDDDRGVLVSSVVAAGPSDGILKSGDVLLSIDDHPIASDANVELEGERSQFEEVVERKFKGDSVKIDILRDKQPM